MVEIFRVIVYILMIIEFLGIFIIGFLIVEGQGVFRYIDNRIGYIIMFVGPILVILIFGFICTILKIEEHLKFIRFGTTWGDVKVAYKSDNNIDDYKSWKCSKCDHLNPNNTLKCRKCQCQK